MAVISTIKYIGEINTFSNTGPHKVSYALTRSQYGHQWWHDTYENSFTFSLGIGKYFIGNALCSSDNCVTLPQVTQQVTVVMIYMYRTVIISDVHVTTYDSFP